MLCKQCGKSLPDEAQFCMHCGAIQRSPVSGTGTPLMPPAAARRAAVEARQNAARAAALLRGTPPKVSTSSLLEEDALPTAARPLSANQRGKGAQQETSAHSVGSHSNSAVSQHSGGKTASAVHDAKEAPPKAEPPAVEETPAAPHGATQVFTPPEREKAPAQKLPASHSAEVVHTLPYASAAEAEAARVARAAEIFTHAQDVANEDFTREFDAARDGAGTAADSAHTTAMASAPQNTEPDDTQPGNAAPDAETTDSDLDVYASEEDEASAPPHRGLFHREKPDPESAATQAFDPTESKRNPVLRALHSAGRNVANVGSRAKDGVANFFSDPRRTVVTVIVAVLLCAVIIPCAIFAGNTVKRLEGYVNDGNWQSAAALYKDKIAGDAEKKQTADAMLAEKLQTAYADYNAGTMEYLKAQTRILTIHKMKVLADTQSAVDALTALHNSKAAFSAGETHLSKSEWLKARDEYRKVIQGDTLYATAVQQADKALRLYRSDAISQAETLLTESGYDEAIALLREALKILPDDAELKKELTHCIDAAVNAALKAASDAFGASHDWKKASDVINKALEKYPDNQKLNDALAEYATYKPVWLQTLTPGASQGDLLQDTVLRDSFGNTYTHSLALSTDLISSLISGITGQPSSDTSRGKDKDKDKEQDEETEDTPAITIPALYVEYPLNGQYLRFTGVCAVPENASSFDFFGRDSYFVVKVDDKTLFTSESMKNQSAPQSFTLDVTGGKTLRIEWPTSSSARSYLFDGQLSK